MTNLHKTALVAFAGIAAASPSIATAADKQAVTVSAETQDFSQDLGSLRAVRLEYKLEADDTTVTFSPVYGERKSVALNETSAGAGVAVYQNWSNTLSTRSAAFISEDDPVFAHFYLAQDVTAKVGKSTSVTVGGRWARFFGENDVYFGSVGVRQYFKRGSIAYRLSLVDTEGRDPFLAHLVNLVIKDRKGEGETRIWLSAGEASYSRPQLGDQFSGNDLGATVKRVQPIGGNIALTLTAGVNSYAREGNDLTSTTFGIGLTSTFGGSQRDPIQ